jgi:hypothetical protein
MGMPLPRYPGFNNAALSRGHALGAARHEDESVFRKLRPQFMTFLTRR